MSTMNAKKRALGKGLGALLDTGGLEYTAGGYDLERDTAPQPGTIAYIPLNQIESNPFQPRKEFEEEALLELANSIKEQGIIQPVTVRQIEPGKYQLISGERRCKASRIAGLTEVPAYIRSADDQAMLEMAIVENIQRADLNPIEVAIGYQQLMDEYQFTQEALSERLGKSRSSVANFMRLLRLPAEIQHGLQTEMISMGHARALITVEDLQTQIDIFHDIVEQALSVREVEEIVRNLANEPYQKQEEKSSEPRPDMSAQFKELQRQLSKQVGHKVVIKVKPNGKGSLVINFKDQEALDNIINLLSKE